MPHRWPHREPPQEEGGKSGKAGPAPHDHLLAVVDEHGVLRHDFTADLPNAAWLRDISEHPTREGKLLDLYPLRRPPTWQACGEPSAALHETR